MTVYADSLFLVNFVSVYIMLMLTEKLSSSKIRTVRRLAAAALGAAVSVMIFCTGIHYIICVILRLLNVIFIICAAYAPDTDGIRRAAPVFAAVSLIYSLTASAMSSFIGGSVIKNGIAYLNVNEIIFFAAFAVTYPAVILIFWLIKHCGSRRIYRISVSKNGCSVSSDALYDSGNLLTCGGHGVIIAEWDIIKPLFKCGTYDELYSLMSELNLQILPFRSLGAQSRTVLVFSADSVSFTQSGTEFKNVPIGIVNHPISSKGAYHMLVGKEYI